MALSRKTAVDIAQVVASDGTSTQRIGWLFGIIYDPETGVAGSMRNLFYMFTFRDPRDAATAARVCTGIAEATSSAINNAIKAEKLPGVSRATDISRETEWFASDTFGKMHHTATRVILTDGTDVVFDWHATLQAGNPGISRTSDWVAGRWGTTLYRYSDSQY